jgi:NADH-quinone oxidoreductase subunit N
VVAFIRNQIGSEDLKDYAGLIQRAPVLVVALSIFLLSLLGLPPLAGFAAKFQIFQALYDAGQMYANDKGALSLAYTMYALLVIGGLNTVLSLVYYIKVVKVAILDPPAEELAGRPVQALPVPAGSVIYSVLLSALILVVGIFWHPLAKASDQGVARFHKAQPKVTAPAVASASAE